MRRSIALLGLPLLLLAGCAGPGADPASAPTGTPTGTGWPAFDQRAAAVADNWRPGEAWRSGYVPLQDGTVLTGDPGFTPDTEWAFAQGWYRDQVELPATRPADGTIRFPDGTLRVPLVSAAAAYAELDKGDPSPCAGRPMKPRTGGPRLPGPGGPTIEPGPDGWLPTPMSEPCVPLTVTAVTLGSATVRTSRGAAEVPAWLFTVEGLRVPVARVAVAPNAVRPVPQVTAPTGPVPRGLLPVQRLDAADAARLDFHVGTGACDSEPSPLVLERADLVVIGAGVTTRTGPCTRQMIHKPVTVTLKAPVGNRAVLDVGSGAPLLVGRR